MERAFVDPSRLDELNIHPSMRMRIDHGLSRRSEPYIGEGNLRLLKSHAGNAAARSQRS
ncbi:hypothetical protein [Streptomyces sp. NBC_00827]|uniref:hypothetical protein n=1 Tax=Streptomyces sp. NBC_00827 TaxID=2903677 RepID=UPI00386912D2